MAAGGGTEGVTGMTGQHDGGGGRRRCRALGLAALMLLMLGAAPAGAQTGRAIGAVGGLVGDCRVARAGEAAARPLAVGSELYEGDRVRTTADARLRLEFVDGSVVQLGAGTELALDWFLHDPAEQTQNVVLRASAGILRVIARLVLPRAAYVVQTPTAAASVRGTDWIVEAGNEQTAIVALQGRVAVRNVSDALPGEVVLGPGEGVTVTAGAPPPAPTIWGETRRLSFIERTTVP